MSTVQTINLGIVKGVHFGLTAPSNIKILWYDDNPLQKILKYYNPQTLAWEPISNATVTPDATESIKGKIKIAGDLEGTADEPRVKGLDEKADASDVNTALEIINEALEDLENQIGQGGTVETIVSDLTVGGINANTSVTVGTAVANANTLKALLQKVFNPTFQNPSFSLSNNAGGLREINEVIEGLVLSLNFNRGAINGALSGGIWNQNGFQNSRAGTATSYTLAGVTQVNSSYQLNNYTVVQGINNFTGSVSYQQGPQPKNSKNQNFDIPFSAGSSGSLNTSFEGVYPIFATTVTLVTPQQQALQSMLTGNNLEYTLVAEVNGNKQFFEIPQTWNNARPLRQVQFFNTISNQYDATNQLSTFNQIVQAKVVRGTLINYVRFTNNALDRGSLRVKLIF